MKIYDEQEETLVTNAAPTQNSAKPEVSVFLPVYDEEPNLLPLHAKLDEALKALGRSAERTPMAGYVTIPATWPTHNARDWIGRSLAYVAGLPPKKPKAAAKPRR